MKELLEGAYREIAEEWNLPGRKAEQANISQVIKKALAEFTAGCSLPALWCYGEHTKMLMVDFVFEIKNVRYIIDRNRKDSTEGGFQIISEDEICKYGIDGIVISTFQYRDEIKTIIKDRYPQLRYLDLYEALEEQGIACTGEYYNLSHPYMRYRRINLLRRTLETCAVQAEKFELYEELIKIFIEIKDFATAVNVLEEYLNINGSSRNQERLEHLRNIYSMQMSAAAHISGDNVVALCVDGLRGKDLTHMAMPKLYRYVSDHMLFFSHAYSVSTSTFESLIPTFSENMDLRTKYYESSHVYEEDCRFIREAVGQGRNVYFYSEPLVEGPHTKMAVSFQTASEKLWDFILDAVEEQNGLFYVHILFESHFSFPNPYTRRELIASGTHILFDFLPGNGGKVKTDYLMQHTDALRYLDDILTPVLERLNVSMLLFADHGNLIIDEKTSTSDIPYPLFSFGKDLTEIPLAIKGQDQKKGRVETPISLSELNNIMIALMRKDTYHVPQDGIIKIQRSELYNPDFKYIYQKAGFEKGLLAFELFIFELKYKLVIYADGRKELYDIDDVPLSDPDKISELYQKIQDQVTVL